MTVQVQAYVMTGDVFTPETTDSFLEVLDVQANVTTRRPLPVHGTLDLATNLALRRAELHGRPVWPLDVEYMLSMWCRWPFKPPPPTEYRQFVEQGLEPLIIDGDLDGLTAVIREPALALSFEVFYAAQQAPNMALLFASAPSPHTAATT